MEGVFKVCPRCGEEYQHTALRCSDCDVALEAPGASPVEPDVFPDVAELTCLRVADPGWVGRLSERLSREELPHRIEPVGEAGAQRFGLFVLPADEARAKAIDEEHLKSEIPELHESDGEPEPAGEGCPACGDAVPEAAGECPGCGLVILS